MFIPKDNEKDLADIPDNVKKGLKVIAVAHVDDVIARALSRKPEPIHWEEPPSRSTRWEDRRTDDPIRARTAEPAETGAVLMRVARASA